MYGIGGLIFIGGFILGIIMGFVQYNNYYDYYSEHTMFSFSTTLYYWLRAFISGTAIVAVGEIINVLQKILNKTK
jgi:DMSO reductase anchor subunit